MKYIMTVIKQLNIAPRTKDGKHEIVFTTEAMDNHDFQLRSAFEGRRVGELIKTLRTDQTRARELSERYPQFLKEYDCVEDVEGLFSSISVPYMGRIHEDRKIKRTREGMKFEEGNSLIPPFIPIFCASFPFVQEGALESFERSIYQWDDSVNWLTPQLPYEEIVDGVPELGNYNPRRLSEFAHMLRVDKQDLETIRKDETMMKGLEDIAHFHILRALEEARGYQSDFGLCERAPLKSHWENHACISPELTRTLANSAVALCDEYLGELSPP